MKTETSAFRRLIEITLADVGPNGSARVYEAGAFSDDAMPKTRDVDAILAECNATGEDIFCAYNDEGRRVTRFTLVWGNAPDELVSDYSVNPTSERIWQAWRAAF